MDAKCAKVADLSVLDQILKARTARERTRLADARCNDGQVVGRVVGSVILVPADRSKWKTPEKQLFDLCSPNSPLATVDIDLKSLINVATFKSLPATSQEQLLSLLPSTDRISIESDPSRLKLVLNNEYFSKACVDWCERLSLGEFTPTSIRRRRALSSVRSARANESARRLFFGDNNTSCTRAESSISSSRYHQLSSAKNTTHDLTTSFSELTTDSWLRLSEIPDLVTTALDASNSGTAVLKRSYSGGCGSQDIDSQLACSDIELETELEATLGMSDSLESTSSTSEKTKSGIIELKKVLKEVTFKPSDFGTVVSQTSTFTIGTELENLDTATSGVSYGTSLGSERSSPVRIAGPGVTIVHTSPPVLLSTKMVRGKSVAWKMMHDVQGSPEKNGPRHGSNEKTSFESEATRDLPAGDSRRELSSSTTRGHLVGLGESLDDNQHFFESDTMCSSAPYPDTDRGSETDRASEADSGFHTDGGFQGHAENESATRLMRTSRTDSGSEVSQTSSLERRSAVAKSDFGEKHDRSVSCAYSAECVDKAVKIIRFPLVNLGRRCDAVSRRSKHHTSRLKPQAWNGAGDLPQQSRNESTGLTESDDALLEKGKIVMDAGKTKVIAVPVASASSQSVELEWVVVSNDRVVRKQVCHVNVPPEIVALVQGSAQSASLPTHDAANANTATSSCATETDVISYSMPATNARALATESQGQPNVSDVEDRIAFDEPQTDVSLGILECNDDLMNNNNMYKNTSSSSEAGKKSTGVSINMPHGSGTFGQRPQPKTVAVSKGTIAVLECRTGSSSSMFCANSENAATDQAVGREMLGNAATCGYSSSFDAKCISSMNRRVNCPSRKVSALDNVVRRLHKRCVDVNSSVSGGMSETMAKMIVDENTETGAVTVTVTDVELPNNGISGCNFADVAPVNQSSGNAAAYTESVTSCLPAVQNRPNNMAWDARVGSLNNLAATAPIDNGIVTDTDTLSEDGDGNTGSEASKNNVVAGYRESISLQPQLATFKNLSRVVLSRIDEKRKISLPLKGASLAEFMLLNSSTPAGNNLTRPDRLANIVLPASELDMTTQYNNTQSYHRHADKTNMGDDGPPILHRYGVGKKQMIMKSSSTSHAAPILHPMVVEHQIRSVSDTIAPIMPKRSHKKKKGDGGISGVQNLNLQNGNAKIITEIGMVTSKECAVDVAPITRQSSNRNRQKGGGGVSDISNPITESRNTTAGQKISCGKPESKKTVPKKKCSSDQELLQLRSNALVSYARFGSFSCASPLYRIGNFQCASPLHRAVRSCRLKGANNSKSGSQLSSGTGRASRSRLKAQPGPAVNNASQLCAPVEYPSVSKPYYSFQPSLDVLRDASKSPGSAVLSLCDLRKSVNNGGKAALVAVNTIDAAKTSSNIQNIRAKSATSMLQQKVLSKTTTHVSPRLNNQFEFPCPLRNSPRYRSPDEDWTPPWHLRSHSGSPSPAPSSAATKLSVTMEQPSITERQLSIEGRLEPEQSFPAVAPAVGAFSHKHNENQVSSICRTSSDSAATIDEILTRSRSREKEDKTRHAGVNSGRNLSAKRDGGKNKANAQILKPSVAMSENDQKHKKNTEHRDDQIQNSKSKEHMQEQSKATAADNRVTKTCNRGRKGREKSKSVDVLHRSTRSNVFKCASPLYNFGGFRCQSPLYRMSSFRCASPAHRIIYAGHSKKHKPLPNVDSPSRSSKKLSLRSTVKMVDDTKRMSSDSAQCTSAISTSGLLAMQPSMIRSSMDSESSIHAVVNKVGRQRNSSKEKTLENNTKSSRCASEETAQKAANGKKNTGNVNAAALNDAGEKTTRLAVNTPAISNSLVDATKCAHRTRSSSTSRRERNSSNGNTCIDTSSKNALEDAPSHESKSVSDVERVVSVSQNLEKCCKSSTNHNLRVDVLMESNSLSKVPYSIVQPQSTSDLESDTEPVVNAEPDSTVHSPAPVVANERRCPDGKKVGCLRSAGEVTKLSANKSMNNNATGCRATKASSSNVTRAKEMIAVGEIGDLMKSSRAVRSCRFRKYRRSAFDFVADLTSHKKRLSGASASTVTSSRAQSVLCIQQVARVCPHPALQMTSIYDITTIDSTDSLSGKVPHSPCTMSKKVKGADHTTRVPDEISGLMTKNANHSDKSDPRSVTISTSQCKGHKGKKTDFIAAKKGSSTEGTSKVTSINSNDKKAKNRKRGRPRSAQRSCASVANIVLDTDCLVHGNQPMLINDLPDSQDDDELQNNTKEPMSKLQKARTLSGFRRGGAFSCASPSYWGGGSFRCASPPYKVSSSSRPKSILGDKNGKRCRKKKKFLKNTSKSNFDNESLAITANQHIVLSANQQLSIVQPLVQVVEDLNDHCMSRKSKTVSSVTNCDMVQIIATMPAGSADNNEDVSVNDMTSCFESNRHTTDIMDTTENQERPNVLMSDNHLMSSQRRCVTFNVAPRVFGLDRLEYAASYKAIRRRYLKNTARLRFHGSPDKDAVQQRRNRIRRLNSLGSNSNSVELIGSYDLQTPSSCLSSSCLYINTQADFEDIKPDHDITGTLSIDEARIALQSFNELQRTVIEPVSSTEHSEASMRVSDNNIKIEADTVRPAEPDGWIVINTVSDDDDDMPEVVPEPAAIAPAENVVPPLIIRRVPDKNKSVLPVNRAASLTSSLASSNIAVTANIGTHPAKSTEISVAGVVCPKQQRYNKELVEHLPGIFFAATTQPVLSSLIRRPSPQFTNSARSSFDNLGQSVNTHVYSTISDEHRGVSIMPPSRKRHHNTDIPATKRSCPDSGRSVNVEVASLVKSGSGLAAPDGSLTGINAVSSDAPSFVITDNTQESTQNIGLLSTTSSNTQDTIQNATVLSNEQVTSEDHIGIVQVLPSDFITDGNSSQRNQFLAIDPVVCITDIFAGIAELQSWTGNESELNRLTQASISSAIIWQCPAGNALCTENTCLCGAGTNVIFTEQSTVNTASSAIYLSAATGSFGVTHEANQHVVEHPGFTIEYNEQSSGESNASSPVEAVVTEIFQVPATDEMIAQQNQGDDHLTVFYSLTELDNIMEGFDTGLFDPDSTAALDLLAD